jgi:rubrerythrin
MLKNQNYAQFVNLMLSDLKNEKKHMLFYLTAASTVSGLHREEYRELFLKEANSEMQHVVEFQDALLGLGVDFESTTDVFTYNPYILSYDPKELLKFALEMESEVVANYAARIAENLNLLEEPDKRWMEIFYEDQLEKSRKDVDNIRMILRSL